MTIETTQVASPTHQKDADCIRVDEYGTCLDCGVGGGDPCHECGGVRFHAEGCSLSDATEPAA